MKTKVELRERFETLILHGTNTTMDRNRLFDLFWDEIEAREKEIKTLTSISHLESLVKEADGIVRQYEMGDLSQVELCIKHYNQLKTKSQS